MTVGRQAFLIAPLIVSVIAHWVVMEYMSPHVMTEYSETIRRSPRRHPMELKAAKVPPKAVHFETVKDLQALRDAPDASTEVALPTASANLELSESDGVTPPLLSDPERLVPPQPVNEVLPKFSKSFDIGENTTSFVTPIAESAGFGFTSPKATQEIPETQEVMVENIDIPPAPPPAMDIGFDPREDALLPEEEKKDSGRFVPPKEILNEVDEEVVAAEKNAVRNLLDVRNAGNLSSFVKVRNYLHTENDWTYFKVKVSPAKGLEIISKDVVILMDASGSIANDRLRSCRAAAKELLRTCLNSGDRFNLVAFRNKFSYAFKNWKECDAESFEEADRWMNKLVAHGRTDVFATISSVLKLPRDPKRPLIALVVTDGDANAGISETSEILSKFTNLNDGLVSIYMYGVKESANRELLDLLTRGNRGESFVWEGSRKTAGQMIGDFGEVFRDPVLTDLRVVPAADSQSAEIYPRRLRNLYIDRDIELIGRVPSGTKSVSFSLRGLNGSKAYEGFFTVDLANSGKDAFLSEDWSREKAIDARLK